MCLCVCWLVLYNVTTGSKDSDFSLTGKAVIFKLLNLFLFYVRPTCQPNEIAKFYQIRKIFINNYNVPGKMFTVLLRIHFHLSYYPLKYTLLYYTLQYSIYSCIFVYRQISVCLRMPTALF